MGWEKRARGGSYYVRKVREGGCVRSVYGGPGEAGRRAEAEDLARREAKRDERRSRRRPPAPLAPTVIGVLPEQPQTLPGGAINALGRVKFPLRRAHFVSFSVAYEQISASKCLGVDLAGLIAGLEVDEVTRLLLRRKFLKVCHLGEL
jgi:hypothetical protein